MHSMCCWSIFSFNWLFCLHFLLSGFNFLEQSICLCFLSHSFYFVSLWSQLLDYQLVNNFYSLIRPVFILSYFYGEIE